MKWQPIGTAPLDGESVLLYYGSERYVMEGRCFKRERGYRKNVHYQWVTAIDMGELEPTHWMPLPEPPSGAIKADRQHRGEPVDPPGDNFGSAEHWKEKAQYWAAEAHKARQQALREEPVKNATTARTSDDQP